MPLILFFFFTSVLIPIAVGTMIVGAILVMGYERLLSHWALKGFNDMQRLGLMTGALGFWALFFDPILELLDRLGTSVLGGAFVLPSITKKEDHPKTLRHSVSVASWPRTA